MKIPKVICPKCGDEMEDVSLGWKCRGCRSFVDMHFNLHEHKEVPFMPPMTNADRIRAMSDEELATFIYTATRACNEYDCESCPIGDENCPDLVKWLKQPAEEVDHEP